MNQKRILFIVKERNVYGAKTRCYGLFNSCNFVARKLNEIGIVSKTIQVIDNNCIDRVVSEFKPTHCIIEALWVVPEKFKILAKLHPHVTWNVRIHSAAPFLATEGISTQWIKEYQKLSHEGIKIEVSANHIDCVEDLRVINPKIEYLPNIYYPEFKEIKPEVPIIETGNHIINIGCFGALRPLKNHFKQACLAIKFAKHINKKLHFFINVSEHETKEAGPVLKNLIDLFKHREDSKLIPIPWYNHDEFIQIVKQMDIGMQLSFTETFNIVAADFVASNIPVVTSRSIGWLSDLYQADIDNDKQIIQKLDLAYNLKDTSADFRCLDHYNKLSLNQWKQYLNIQ